MELKFQKVSFKYQRSYPNSLDEISIKFKDGTINSIIGNNGSGKSTLLKLMSGVLKPTKGKIIFDDIIFSRRSSEHDISVIMQKIGYLPQVLNNKLTDKSVADEISCSDLSKIEEIFKVLNISIDVLDEEYSFLNNILQRKVALSKILIYNPNVIVLDEPTMGLDSATKKSLINYLIKLKKLENKMIIIASNDIDFVNRISDNVAILENGKVILLENKNDIFRNVNFFYSHNLPLPKIIEFKSLVLREKGIHLGYRDDVNDLIKDILRKC